MQASLAGLCACLAGIAWAGDDSPAIAVSTDVGIRDSSQDEQELRKALNSLWDLRRSEIGTARIRFRDLVIHPEPEHAPTIEAVQLWMAATDFAADPDSLLELLPQLTDQEFLRDPPWSTSVVTLQGDRVRWAVGPFDAVIDGDLEFHVDHDNAQVNVHPRDKSQRYITRPAELRFVPHEKFSTLAYRATGREDGRIDVVGVVSQMVVDEATGLVASYQARREAQGELVQEHWEQGFAEFPGQVPFPTVSVRAAYRDGRLGRIWFRLIEEAEFNGDVPADAFHVALPEDYVVIDYRGQSKRTITLRAATDDLRSVLGRPDRAAAARSGAPSPQRWRWLLAANGLALLAVGVYLWNSARPRTANTSHAPSATAEQTSVPLTPNRSS